MIHIVGRALIMASTDSYSASELLEVGKTWKRNLRNLDSLVKRL